MIILKITVGKVPDNRIDREALALREAGHKVSIICSNIASEKNSSNYDEIFTISYSKGVKALYPKDLRKARKLVSRIVKKVNPDVIHAHNLDGAAIIIGLKLPKKCVFVYDDHEVWPIFNKMRMQKPMNLPKKLVHLYRYILTKHFTRKVIRKIDYLIVVNEYWINYYNKKFGATIEKSFAIENFANEDVLELANNNLDKVEQFILEDRRKKIVHASKAKVSESSSRNIFNIAKAVSELDDWVIIVFGPTDKSYEEMDVKFFSLRPREEFLANCKKCDLALNSLILNERAHYTSSNRVFEFALLGLQILSTEINTLKDKFDNKLIWVNPTSPIKEIKSRLTKYKQYASGEEIQQYAKNYTWKISAKKLVSKYEEIALRKS